MLSRSGALFETARLACVARSGESQSRGVTLLVLDSLESTSVENLINELHLSLSVETVFLNYSGETLGSSGLSAGFHSISVGKRGLGGDSKSISARFKL